uniref:Chitin-binding type-2 domain-containing protein n=1 Tax=Heliothis virescens TaxID=7102 RepID=A0A2A4JMS6_HELVI
MTAQSIVTFLLLCCAYVAQAAVDCRTTGAGRFADPDDEKCKNYTLCIYVRASDSYLAYNAVCPSISLFNPHISRCTAPTNYVCNHTILVPNPEPTTICTYDGFIADPEPTNCTTYIQCVKIKGEFTQLRHRCPWTTYFNPNTTLCESNYTCTRFTCTTPGRIPDLADFTCRKYYYCVQLFNGTFAQFTYSCPENSFFNPTTKLCTTHYSCR